MTNRFRASIIVGPALVALLSVTMLTGCRTQPGQAAAYAPPRTPDGKPDLNGLWQVLNTANWNIQDHVAQMGVPAGQSVVENNEVPYQPAAATRRKENFDKRATDDPATKCYLPGVPRATYMPFPFQITQTPKYVAITYEYDHASRIVYTDGSSHPEGALEFWMGDSRGRWEGDTLVVDVTHFTDQTWFDNAGNFHSNALHVVERYTRTGPDTLTYDVTIEDPKVFTRPWKMSMPLYRRLEKNIQLLDYECVAFVQEKAVQ